MIIIHKFKNPYLLKFLCKYKEEIEAFPNGMHEKYQIGTSSDHCGFRYTLISDKAPFGQADDRIAVDYGLKDYLISALEKMVTSGNYCEESQREMSERIEHWRQFNA